LPFQRQGPIFGFQLVGRNHRLSRLLIVLAGLAFFSNAIAAVSITMQPQNQTVLTGATVSLKVSVAADDVLGYQWRFNGVPVFAATNSNLPLTNVTVSMSGPYDVVASTPSASSTSTVAFVSVNEPGIAAGGYAAQILPPGYSLISSALFPWTNHVVANVFAIPDWSNGTTIIKVDGNGFVANNYLEGWTDPEMNIVPGEGWFFRNPGAESIVAYELGFAVGGFITNRLPEGFAACRSIQPYYGGLSDALRFSPTVGTQVYVFDPATQTYSEFTRQMDGEWSPYEPYIPPWHAFFVRSAATQDWVHVFTNGIGGGVLTQPFLMSQPRVSSEAGEINFFTFSTDQAFGRVFDIDGTTPLGTNFCGQLYFGANPGNLRPVGDPVSFLRGAVAGWIRGTTIKLPGTLGGQVAWFQLRVWNKAAGRAHETALARGRRTGHSARFAAILRAPIENGRPGLPPPDANMFPSFRLTPRVDPDVRIVNIRREGTSVFVSFSTRAAQQYRLECASSVDLPVSWNAVAGAEAVAGTGDIVTVAHRDADQSHTIYRVSVNVSP
jgi:hypothetical protein